jgi:hypothetical protein
MQFFLDFKTFLLVKWVFKSGLPCRKNIVRSFHHFSLAGGMADRGPASTQTLKEIFFKF